MYVRTILDDRNHFKNIVAQQSRLRQDDEHAQVPTTGPERSPRVVFTLSYHSDAPNNFARVEKKSSIAILN